LNLPFLIVWLIYFICYSINIFVFSKDFVTFCDKNGLKIYKVVQKWIDDTCKPKKKDIYGEN